MAFRTDPTDNSSWPGWLVAIAVLAGLAALPIFDVPHWRAILSLTGFCFELTGILCMANRYLDSPRREVVFNILSALWRGEWAKNAAAGAEVSGEKNIISLQGLAFIGAGFSLQAVPPLIDLGGMLANTAAKAVGETH